MTPLPTDFLEQLERDEAAVKADISSLEKRLQNKKNELFEIQASKKRFGAYLSSSQHRAEEKAVVIANSLLAPTSPRRRSMGDIKRRALEAYSLPEGLYRTVSEAVLVSRLTSDQIRSATKDAKDRGELEVHPNDSARYRISPKGLARLKEHFENQENTLSFQPAGETILS